MPQEGGHALSTPFGALKLLPGTRVRAPGGGACPLNALRGTETTTNDSHQAQSQGACPLNALRGTETVAGCAPCCGPARGGHALSTPFGALKPRPVDEAPPPLSGACPLNALRGTET